MATTIQVRVEDELKAKSDKLFKELGTDTTTAIRMFLTQAVANEGFPFEIKKNPRTRNVSQYEVLTEEEMLEKLRIAREHSTEGKQRNASLVVSDMRTKYEL